MEQSLLPPPWYIRHNEGNNPIGNEGMGFLGGFQSLKELILWGCGITGEGLEKLSATELKLETLNLGID